MIIIIRSLRATTEATEPFQECGGDIIYLFLLFCFVFCFCCFGSFGQILPSFMGKFLSWGLFLRRLSNEITRDGPLELSEKVIGREECVANY